MSRHDCPGLDDCHRCQRAIDRIEHERIFGDGYEEDV